MEPHLTVPSVMRYPRSAGILCHVSSLPNRYGCGDFGPDAWRFVDTLKRCGVTLWQVLPLGPTGYGNSPYQSLSAYAGNPLFISPEILHREGWLTDADLEAGKLDFADLQVDFERVIRWRHQLLAHSFVRFLQTATDDDRAAMETFRREQAWWLDEYALFIALKEAHQEALWTHWQRQLVHRKEAALAEARQRHQERIAREIFIQYQFWKQWNALRSYAHDQGIRIMGDTPIFVAHDSADVWSNQDLFHLDADGWPTVVAGVPPDYFSATGQLWGNPLYRWDELETQEFGWWAKRMRHAMQLFDLVRLDHFRGFEAYWEIPADAPDASTGRWVYGPGLRFFQALDEAVDNLKIVAEDLGVITAPVEALRDAIGAPGMRVLQFAFGNDQKASDYRPHNYIQHAVVYTGTHDNDTTVGWFHSEVGGGTTRSAAEIEQERRNVLAYVGTDGTQIHWDLIRLALASVADTAIIPLQDLLGLGNQARMNLPGSAGGNWRWRFRWESLTHDLEQRLNELCEVYERSPRTKPPETAGELPHAVRPTEMV